MEVQDEETHLGRFRSCLRRPGCGERGGTHFRKGGDGAAVSELVAASSGDGTGEGIAVNGHWALTVRDPDGTVVETREFDNSVTSSGKAALVSFLRRGQSVGAWSISLTSATATSPCWDATASSRRGCTIQEASTGFTEARGWFVTLTPSAGANNTFVLTGAATALLGAPPGEQSGAVAAVTTSIGGCLASVPPSVNCVAVTTATFSQKILTTPDGAPAPVTVTSGQQIDVTVTFSIS